MALKAKPLAAVRADVPTHLVQENVQLNIEIPKELRKDLRRMALDRDVTMTALIQDLLHREVETEKTRKIGS